MENILILTYPNDMLLKKSLYRIHTSYEAGKLSGKLKGINFPVNFLNTWSKTIIPTQEEQKIITQSRKYLYVIAVTENDPKTLIHEKAHALFFLNNTYKKQAEKIWNNLTEKTQKIIITNLKLWGYNQEHFIDEFQAYSIEDSSVFGKSSYMEISSKIKPLKTLFAYYNKPM